MGIWGIGTNVNKTIIILFFTGTLLIVTLQRVDFTEIIII